MVSPVHPLWSWFIATHLLDHPYFIPSYPFSSFLLILNLLISHPYSSYLLIPIHSPYLLILIRPVFSYLLSFLLRLFLATHPFCHIKSSFTHPTMPILSSLSSHPYLSVLLILFCPIFSSLFVLSSHPNLSHLSHPYLSVILILVCLIFSPIFVRTSHPNLSFLLILIFRSSHPNLSRLLIYTCLIFSTFFLHSYHQNLSHLLILICPFVSSTSHPPFFPSPWPIRRLFMISLVMFNSFLVLSTLTPCPPPSPPHSPSPNLPPVVGLMMVITGGVYLKCVGRMPGEGRRRSIPKEKPKA